MTPLGTPLFEEARVTLPKTQAVRRRPARRQTRSARDTDSLRDPDEWERFTDEVYLRWNLEPCLIEARAVVGIASPEELEQTDSDAWCAAEILRQFEEVERGFKASNPGAVARARSRIVELEFQSPSHQKRLADRIILKDGREWSDGELDTKQRRNAVRDAGLLQKTHALRLENPNLKMSEVAHELKKGVKIGKRRILQIIKPAFLD